MLLIVNPKATTVSDRLKNLIVYALRSRYEVTAIDTEARSHAIELTRSATPEEHDLVVAFGGDGTVNEAANGLAGSTVPLSLLPGGSTNVVCRALGIPCDVIDATEHLLALADGLKPRRIDLGRVNGRYFVSSAGVGLDADTTRWVDQRARLKSRAGPLWFAYAGLATYYGRYLHRPPLIAAQAAGREVEGVAAVVQNSDPYTYFKSRPLRVCEGAGIDNGMLSMVVLRRARQRDVPIIGWKLLSGRGRVSEHPSVESFTGLEQARVRAIDSDARPGVFPVQVDGDYIGHYPQADIDVTPDALSVVA
jgi:diacylglycerol kinase family enzyme